MNKQSWTNSDGSTRTRMWQSNGAGCCHDKSLLPMTESWRGECRPPLNKSTCWGCWGTPRAISGDSSGFQPPNLPVFAWRAAGDISAEVFSMSKPSCMEVVCGNGDIHSRTSHTMMMMMIDATATVLLQRLS